MKNICVVGSINMDLVAVSEKRPLAGETVLGEAFFTNPGGKGANQAVACARLGADVTMLGCVGSDLYGKSLVDNLNNEQINTSHIKYCDGISTGIAHITIAEKDNSIIVVPGANSIADRAYIDEHIDVIKRSDIVLAQLEIPLETVVYLAEVCKENGISFLLNPAPARHLPKGLIDNATYMTPNESEVKILFPEHWDIESLLKLYPNKLVVTLGGEGAVFCDSGEIVKVPSFKADVVDTTGAGDTFNGGFAAAVVQNKSILEAVTFANAAAGISVTKLGAQTGMPNLDEVNRLLR